MARGTGEWVGSVGDSSGRDFLPNRKSAERREGARKHESVLLGDQVDGAVPHWKEIGSRKQEVR